MNLRHADGSTPWDQVIATIQDAAFCWLADRSENDAISKAVGREVGVS